MADERHPSPENGGNGITTRVRLLEYRVGDLRDDLQLLRDRDIHDIAKDVRELRDEFALSRRGLSTSEKIALGTGGISFLAVVVGAVSILVGGPG